MFFWGKKNEMNVIYSTEKEKWEGACHKIQSAQPVLYGALLQIRREEDAWWMRAVCSPIRNRTHLPSSQRCILWRNWQGTLVPNMFSNEECSLFSSIITSEWLEIVRISSWKMQNYQILVFMKLNNLDCSVKVV